MRQSFDFPADTSVLSKIGELATKAGRAAGFNEVEINDINLAVSEVCTNTITHGLKNDPKRTFQIVIQWDDGEIEIFVHEAGEPFNPVDLSDPDLEAPLEDRPVGGLGIYILRQLMDEADFRVGRDGVKTWRMLKRKPKM
jgi:serine/threonine-protein kinase RsbW